MLYLARNCCGACGHGTRERLGLASKHPHAATELGARCSAVCLVSAGPRGPRRASLFARRGAEVKVWTGVRLEATYSDHALLEPSKTHARLSVDVPCVMQRLTMVGAKRIEVAKRKAGVTVGRSVCVCECRVVREL